MNEVTAPFVLGLCLIGNMALIPLIVSVGLIGLLRKIVDWMEARWM